MAGNPCGDSAPWCLCLVTAAQDQLCWPGRHLLVACLGGGCSIRAAPSISSSPPEGLPPGLENVLGFHHVGFEGLVLAQFPEGVTLVSL